MKVLIADKFEAVGLDKLKELGCEVVFEPGLTAETLHEGVTKYNPDVLIVRSTKVKKPAFEVAKSLSLIIRAGAGYDTIDIASASARGVFVANCPGKNSIAVSELAFAHLISCDRRIPDATSDLRAGKWKKGEYSKARGLFGSTMGIVGHGRIAQALMTRVQAFGMKVVMWCPYMTDEEATEWGVKRVYNLVELAELSDAISIHVAANSETKGLIDEKFFRAMKDGAYFINSSRGSVVDYEALKKAISEKGIRAGLDVFASEPGGPMADFDDEILTMPGVYTSPHIGASTEQAQTAVAFETVRIIESYMTSGEIPNVVNLAQKTKAKGILEVRYQHKSGVLAHVLGTLADSSINIEEMENIIYEGGEAAFARINVDISPGAGVIDDILMRPEIISAGLKDVKES